MSLDHCGEPCFDRIPEPADAVRRLGTVQYSRSSALVLEVHGDIDAYTQPRWQAVLDSATLDAMAGGHPRLILDLTGIRFISLRAVIALVEHAGSAHRCRVRVSVAEDPQQPMVARLVGAAGLTAWLPVHPGLDRTLAAAVPCPGMPWPPLPATAPRDGTVARRQPCHTTPGTRH
ncbi:STAS domain-containing protein [Nocardia thailandica]